MLKSTTRPEDKDAPISPRIKNPVQFKGEHLTDEERAELFSGNPVWLRRVAEMAVRKYMSVEDQAS